MSDKSTEARQREFWKPFEFRLDEVGGRLAFPDFSVPDIDPVRRLLNGPKPPEQPPVQGGEPE